MGCRSIGPWKGHFRILRRVMSYTTNDHNPEWIYNRNCSICRTSEMGCQTKGLLDQWAVGPVGCRYREIMQGWDQFGFFNFNSNSNPVPIEKFNSNSNSASNDKINSNSDYRLLQIHIDYAITSNYTLLPDNTALHTFPTSFLQSFQSPFICLSAHHSVPPLTTSTSKCATEPTSCVWANNGRQVGR